MCRFGAFASQGVGRTNSGCHILLHLNLCPKTEFWLLRYEKAEQTLPYFVLAINSMEVNLDSKISILPILLSYLYLLLPILKNNWPKFGQVIITKLWTRGMWFYSSPAFLFPRAVKGKSCIDPKHIIVILTVLLSPSSAQQWPWHFCFAVWWQQIRGWEFLSVSNCSCNYIPETRTSATDVVLPCLASVSFLVACVPWIGSRAPPALLFPLAVIWECSSWALYVTMIDLRVSGVSFGILLELLWNLVWKLLRKMADESLV